MKNIKFLAGLFLIVTAFTFTSCVNEPIDPAIDLGDFDQQCSVPTSFQTSQFINGNSVSLSWVAGANEESWSIQYGVTGFAIGSGTVLSSTETTYVVSGLNSGNSYSFYLRANCSSTSNSQWIGPVTVNAVQNPNCANPSGLTAVRNSTTNTIVDLSWTAGGTETAWEIQYGVNGFALGSGTTVNSTTLTKQINNIATSSGYSFYVRAKCSTTENSNWVGPINVAAVQTGGSGGVVGTYKLTAFNTSVPTDLNFDGTASTNQMDEINCFNDSFLTINANNTFTSDSEGVDISIEVDNNGVEVESIVCYEDAQISGTWSQVGNVITFTYTEEGEEYSDSFTVIGNTLQHTVNSGQVVGTEVTTGAPVYLTSNITLIYTKQ